MKTTPVQRLLAAPIAALLLSAAAAPAFATDDQARCDAPAAGEQLSMDAVIKKAEAEGYTVRSAEREGGCWEVYAVGQDGGRYEVYLHPVTGEVVTAKKKS